MDYTIIVHAGPTRRRRSSGWRRYAGCAMGEYFMFEGKHALVNARPPSSTPTPTADVRRLLLSRGPRGDPGILPLHSRAAPARVQLRRAGAAASSSLLRVVETPGLGDVAYIPTSVISITDGQIFLEADLFFSGVRPAVNVGRSVSRVGASAQTKAMKKVAGRLRLELFQYRELEAFSQFGSELDQATQDTLKRGERMVATLNQPQYAPWPMEEQVVAIYAGIHGFLDDIPVQDVPRFQDELREYLRTEGGVYDEIAETGDLPDELAEKLSAAIERFKQGFNTSDEPALAGAAS